MVPEIKKTVAVNFFCVFFVAQQFLWGRGIATARYFSVHNLVGTEEKELQEYEMRWLQVLVHYMSARYR